MRIRITKSLTGSIDGIQLSRLSQGQIYDVNTPLACYLLTEGMAEPASSDQPTELLPVENRMLERTADTRGKGLILPRSLAADSRKRARNKRKKES